MKRATAYGLAAIGALSALTLTHVARRQGLADAGGAAFILGVMPNLASAVAIPFVLIGIRADQPPPLTRQATWRWFAGSALFAAVGLIGWELVQRTSERFVYDAADIAATLFGLAIATLICAGINRRNVDR